MVEHLVEPLGLGTGSPRLSWWLPVGATRQEAFEIETRSWRSPRVVSAGHLLVPFDGPSARSGERVPWRVKAWTDLGESPWSDWSFWEAGLLEPSDWTATWIRPDEPERPPAGERPAHVFRQDFTIDDQVRRGRAYATAHGLYELFLNGERMGDVELAPGTTAYRTNLDVQTYDVTEALSPGSNEIRAVLSDGWYRGKNGFNREFDCFGTELALLIQLELELDDGRRLTVGTGPGWSTAIGEITRADLIDGQGVDLRRRPEDWHPAPLADLGYETLTASPAPPVRRVEEVRPHSVQEVGPLEHVVDLGQNINGWVRLVDVGPDGTELTLTHGELLDDTGRVTLDHLAPFDFVSREPRSPGQVDTVISRGRPSDLFEPRHTTHGFQYVGIDGHPGPLTEDDVTGVVVHSDLTRTGWFTCSDHRLERLHEAAVWSFRDNACDVPTDCPQRERAPWTGDWQIFAPTAAFLYDVAGFSAKWLRDLAADQWHDGRVPNFTPDPAGPAAADHEIARFLTGSAGWGDAAVIVPWDMWVAYGDDQLLADQFDSMVRWVEFAAGRARSGRHRTRSERRPEPAPHEEFLWDTGFHWGEWCEPGGTAEEVFTLEKDMGDVATAFLHRSSALLSRIATILERPTEAERYDGLARAARDAWQAEFIDDEGRLTPDTQPNLVRALAFGLVPDELRDSVAVRLVELVHEADDHLTTGFLATPFLLPVLADTGHLDIAYTLLFQDTPPSWLAMIDQGATTIWENWEPPGEGDQATGSLNHYSKGAVITFLHQYVAGLRPDPDHPVYERFTVAPMPGGGLTHADARCDSRRGPVRSSWRIEDGRFTLDLEVPPGATADVVLPSGERAVAGPGSSTYQCPA